MSKRSRLLGRLKYVYSHNTKLVLDVSNDDIGLIIEGVEKQIAKKPIIINFYDKTDDSYVRVPRCSRCEEYVYRGEIYCSKCGQKLDWSETDD